MWEERFATAKDFVFGTNPAQFLVDHQTYLKSGDTALFVADGEGRNSVYAARKGLDVTALEFAPTAIARAQQLAQAQQVTIKVQATNILTQPWPETQFDLVAGIFIQFVGPNGRRHQFSNIKAATKPGGLVMLHGYTPRQLKFGTGGPPFEKNMYTEVILRAAFVGWDVVLCHDYEREVQEGRGHSGQSALIDFIARKPL